MKTLTLRKDVAAVKALEADFNQRPDIRDQDHPAYALQTMSKSLLLMVGRGEFDLNAAARIELAARGFDANGSAVPFSVAEKIWLCQEEEIITAKLNDGTVVLAKMRKGEPFPLTYTNRAQADEAASKVGGKVIHRGRPFYVAVEG